MPEGLVHPPASYSHTQLQNKTFSFPNLNIRTKPHSSKLISYSDNNTSAQACVCCLLLPNRRVLFEILEDI